jgi:Cell Wall Hydrolase
MGRFLPIFARRKLNRAGMARVRIKRTKAGQLQRRWHAMPRLVRVLLGFAVIALPIGSIHAARGLADPVGQSVRIALDPPAPFNPAADPISLLQPAALVEPVAITANDIVGVQAPMVMPNAADFSVGPAAAPYVFRGRNATDTLRASLCLTAAIYYEAANEPDEGQRAVAQVVLNRVRHPAWPDTVCDVVYQGTERPGTLCQFTFGCDGALARVPSTSGWIRARRVAQAALAGYVHAPAGLATHYHTLAVSPSWRTSLTPVGIYGAHIFYRLPGGAGTPRAFYAQYRGNEPVPGPRPKLFTPTDPLVFATAGTVDASALAFAPPPAPIAAPTTPTERREVAARPSKAVVDDRRYVTGALPESDIRDEYRTSGEWITR